MRRIVYALIVLLAVLHQDYWWWDDSDTLWFGFMPVGLGYHALVSVAAALLWGLAVRYCWPEGVDELYVYSVPQLPPFARGDKGGFSAPAITSPKPSLVGRATQLPTLDAYDELDDSLPAAPRPNEADT